LDLQRDTNIKVIGVLDKGSKEVPIYVIFPFGHLLVKVGCCSYVKDGYFEDRRVVDKLVG
jgi:hypothetical protein